MIVYAATCAMDGRVYVGATSRALNLRIAQHKCRALTGDSHTPFHAAIREHSCSAFTWRILQSCGGLDELHQAERDWIGRLESNLVDRGYNRTLGGPGSPGWNPPEEVRQRIGQAAVGRVHSEETRAKRSASLKGRKPSEAAIAALRSRIYSPEQRAARAANARGRKHTWSNAALENVRRAAAKRCGIGAKIHPSQFADIRARRDAKESFASIGKTLGVSAATVLKFCRRCAASGGEHQ